VQRPVSALSGFGR